MKYLILFLFVLFTNAVSAEPGCIDVSRTRIYTSFNNGQQYWKTNKFEDSSNGCLYVYTKVSCSIGSSNANNGFIGDTSNPQECDIDSNAFILLFGSIGFGAFMLRKKRDANFIFHSK